MLNNYLSINKKFKSSVNITYDLNNKEKILQYIPTTDLCDVIKSYLKAILDGDFHSSILEGPYGKGKSYLALIILYLLSNHSDRELFKKVVSKFSSIDKELTNIIVEIDEDKINYLPVIIGNSSDDLDQNFMLALRNSLCDNGLESITPDSVFMECLRIISEWEKQKIDGFNIFDVCLSTLKINIEVLKQGLKNYDIKYYKKFLDLFKCVNHGYSFNPLVSGDICKIYSDVSYKIKEYGYTGLFIVFDEFGLFLENQSSGFLTRLNRIQNFAEKCNSSNNYQMHFCCITHKDFSLYSKDKSMFDEFEKISGRFKQIRFDRSLDENYEIICSAIEKNSNYKDLVNIYFSNNTDFFNELENTTLFEKNRLAYLIDNGLPFNPYALYSLIQISEKVAQNERTLFTFLSDNDISGFNYFITNRNNDLLNVPIIYDYFENQIQNSEEYKSIYYKVEALKRLTLKNTNHDIFKTIAIIKIINDKVKFPCNIENIALSLGKAYKDTSIEINILLNKNMLKENSIDKSIDFSIIPDSDVNKTIEEIISTKISKANLSDLLNVFDQNKYYISSEYNFKNCMTRYYRSIYLEASKFMALSSLGNLFAIEFCDGLIINLINDNKLVYSIARQKIEEFNIPNLIVRFTTEKIEKSVVYKIQKLFAIKNIVSLNKNIDYAVKESLSILHDDLTHELSMYISRLYYNSKAINSICINEKSLNKCIYISLNNYYQRTVLFNNEQVNKNIISATTAKSRNAVIQKILLNSKIDFGTTSAEATIEASFNESLDKSNYVLSYIKNWFVTSRGKKINASTLIASLKAAPYGMRDGIIPLFIAKAISSLSVNTHNSYDTILLYNGTSEVSLNAVNLCKVLNDASKYYFCFAEINSSKLQMTKELLKYFNCKEALTFNDNISLLASSFKNKVANLRPIIVKSNKNDNLLDLSNISLCFKDLWLKHDINKYDILFDDLPKLLEKNFDEIANCVEKIFAEYEEKFCCFENSIITLIYDKLGYKSNSLKSSFDLWKSSFDDYIDKIIFENLEKKLLNAFKTIQYNNYDALNILSFAVLSCGIDDWSTKKMGEFFKILDSMIIKVKEYDPAKSASVDDFELDNKDVVFSNLGNTLYSNIKESLEEYGESLSAEEKSMILKKILKEILK